jgi:ParB family transcriptional regulator, chromosome partitioning protein
MSSRRRLSRTLTDAFASEIGSDIGAASALFESAAGSAHHFRRIPVERIRARADALRSTVDADRLTELTDSVRTHGVLQPIRVRPCAAGHYEIIAGERRWLAAQHAGLRNIPAVVVVADDAQAFVESLIENVQREDLNAVDRACALQQLRVNLGLQSWEEVGRVIGLSRQHVHNLLRIADLPAAMQDDVRAGDLTEKHCRALLRLRHDPAAQQQLWYRIHDEQLTGDGALAEARRTWTARDGGSVDAVGGAVRPASARARIGVVIDALVEALGAASDDELAAAQVQLRELHRHLGTLLSAPEATATPVISPLAGVGGPAEEWRPVLLPVAGQHSG